MDRFEEAVAIIKSLYTNERTDFKGRHYVVTAAPLAPKPVQSPLPLLIGGGEAYVADCGQVRGRMERLGHTRDHASQDGDPRTALLRGRT